jgi:nitrogen regulatory protein PII-like uncharacterized protein
MEPSNKLNVVQRGLEIYDGLKRDMYEALGLRQYAENLTQVTNIFRAVNRRLNNEERAIKETLEKALILSREGMRKAVVVVSVIKEQCETLALILSDSIPGGSHEKLADAYFYFSTFAENTAGNVKEAMKTLQKASDELQMAQEKLALMETAMKRVHTELLAELSAAKCRKRAAAYGAAAVGALLGPLGLLISYTAAVSITEGVIIDKLQKEFDQQRENVKLYMAGFTKMREETMGMDEKVEVKCTELSKIHAKLAVVPTEMGPGGELPFIAIVRNRADQLGKACNDFLEECKFMRTWDAV